MIKTTEFIYCNFEDFDLSKYDKDKTLIYLDPPYLLECNTYYSNTEDMRTFYEKLIKIFTTNICLFIHSYNYLLHDKFKQYEFMKYDKTYGNSGNKRVHMVYYNKI